MSTSPAASSAPRSTTRSTTPRSISVRRLGLSLVLAAALGACGNVVAPGGGAVDKTGRKLLEQTFGPPYPPEPPRGRLVHIDRATIDPAREVLTVGFTGANGFLGGDGCSKDYTAWANINAEALQIAIVELEHVQLLPVSCLGLGFLHTHHLQLPGRFAGIEVVDRGGGTFLVGQPEDAANLAHVPPGWFVVHEEAGCCGTDPPVWVRVYSASPVGEPPHEGPGRLAFYQAFGLTDEWQIWRAEKSEGRGGHPESVTMRGEAATVWVDDTAGELLLAWEQGGRSYALIGNSADMTVEELVGYAESLTTTTE